MDSVDSKYLYLVTSYILEAVQLQENPLISQLFELHAVPSLFPICTVYIYKYLFPFHR